MHVFFFVLCNENETWHSCYTHPRNSYCIPNVFQLILEWKHQNACDFNTMSGNVSTIGMMEALYFETNMFDFIHLDTNSFRWYPKAIYGNFKPISFRQQKVHKTIRTKWNEIESIYRKHSANSWPVAVINDRIQLSDRFIWLWNSYHRCGGRLHDWNMFTFRSEAAFPWSICSLLFP